MEQYKKLCRDILENGKYKSDRTNTGTISLFGHQSRYNLNDGFPLLTTKKVFFKGILVELLWIISGSTNIQPLVKQNVHIWDEWPFETYKKSDEYQGETIKETQLKKYFHDDADEQSISNNFIYSLHADYLGNLWIGTYYGG